MSPPPLLRANFKLRVGSVISGGKKKGGGRCGFSGLRSTGRALLRVLRMGRTDDASHFSRPIDPCVPRWSEGGEGGATNRHCSATVAPSLLSAAARGGRHSPGEPRKLVRRRKTRSLAQAPSGSALICVTFKATRCDAEMGLGELSAFGAPCRSDPRRGRRRKDCERDTPDFQEDAQSRRSATFLPPLPISTL